MSSGWYSCFVFRTCLTTRISAWRQVILAVCSWFYSSLPGKFGRSTLSRPRGFPFHFKFCIYCHPTIWLYVTNPVENPATNKDVFTYAFCVKYAKSGHSPFLHLCIYFSLCFISLTSANFSVSVYVCIYLFTYVRIYLCKLTVTNLTTMRNLNPTNLM